MMDFITKAYNIRIFIFRFVFVFLIFLFSIFVSLAVALCDLVVDVETFLIQFNVPFKIISLIETSLSIGVAKREYPGKTT